MSVFKKVYTLVKKIPKGRVATYGEIAHVLGISPRTVGWALHANKDLNVPCHRVVNKEGKVAENYGFGGWREQKRRLLEEGVKFVGEKKVDLGDRGDKGDKGN